jgi:hypothetical protein
MLKLILTAAFFVIAAPVGRALYDLITLGSIIWQHPFNTLMWHLIILPPFILALRLTNQVKGY